MTNQASEDDLELIVARISAGIGGFGKLTSGTRYDGISEEAGIELLKAYIRTEKLKLLAEMREAHRDGYMRGVSDFSGYFMDASNAAQRNLIMPDIASELREAYRAPILSTKLEAEL